MSQIVVSGGVIHQINLLNRIIIFMRKAEKETEQFNLLRIADNENYPAFFILNGQKYILKIYKE